MGNIISKRIVAVALASASTLVMALPVQAQTQVTRRSYSIPAQDLASALEEFGRQSGKSVMFDRTRVAGARSKPVSGAGSPEAVLKRMLKGTGFSVRAANANTFVIETRPQAGRSAHSAPPAEKIASSSNADVPDPAATDSDSAEIIVTAQKREQNLQDVPVPVSVVTSASLIENNQNTLRDYYARIPGLNFTMGNRGEAFVSIRGITTTPFQNPTVGITVDDVPFGSTIITGGGLITPDLDPSDLARIEVLRGPQGTLYGVSSLGGLIKYVTADPSTQRLSGRIQGGVVDIAGGDDLGWSIRGSANLPLSDTFAVRVSGFSRSDPGYVDNITTGEENVNSGDAKGGRIAALWRPTSTFSLKLSALIQSRDTDGSPLIFQAPGLGDLEQTYLRGSGWLKTRLQAYSAIANIDLGGAEITSVTGYNISKISDSVDTSIFLSSLAEFFFDVSGAPIEEHYRTRKFSQELRALIPLTSRIELLVGGFYTNERSRVQSQILAVDTGTGQTVGVIDDTVGTPTYREHALFADVTFNLTDKFTVQFGGRQSFNRVTYAATSAGFFYPASGQVTPRSVVEESPFTYLLTPQYAISPDFMVYARLASGYRAGGVNPNFILGLNVPPGWSSDSTRNIEIGAKGSALGGALTFDASLYHIDWEDIQLQFVPVSGAYVTNGGDARSQGLELSVQARPVDGLTISGAFTWNHARLTEALSPLTGLVGNPGDRLPFSSRLSGNVSIDQEFSLSSDAKAFVGGTLTYVGKRLGLFQGTVAARQEYPDYIQIDLRAGVEFGDWRTNLFVTNLTDRRGLLGGGAGGINPAAFSIIQPRSVGLSLARNF